jgi:hypothetical protein
MRDRSVVEGTRTLVLREQILEQQQRGRSSKEGARRASRQCCICHTIARHTREEGVECCRSSGHFVYSPCFSEYVRTESKSELDERVRQVYCPLCREPLHTSKWPSTD